MITTRFRLGLAVEPGDYFYVKPDIDGTYQITLTDSSGGPVHLTSISRRQLFGLLTQAQRALVSADEERAETLFQTRRSDEVGQR